MTVYELYELRRNAAFAEWRYGKGLGSVLGGLRHRYWNKRIYKAAVGDLEKELAVRPQRRTKHG